MDYQVSARKYRPGTFDDVVGQSHVVQTLMNAVDTKRIAHAYLFSGTRGVGKTTVARILAKALNCEQGPTGHPCNTCVNCVEITQGTSVDVMEIDGASNTSVDDVREIRENVKFSPFRGHYRVYIIDEVHMLSNSAFNALLKTLEEPPSHVVFIFATTEIHKIPATIMSRCQHYNFRRIARQEIIDRLRHVASQDGMTIEDRSFTALARASEGSMRDGLSLLDQAVAFGGKTIAHADLEVLLGAVPQELVQGMSAAILAQNSQAALAVLANLLDQGHDLKAFCSDVVELLRNLLVASVVPAGPELRGLIEATEEDIQQLAVEAKKLTPEQLQELLTIFSQAEDSLRYSAHPRFVLEAAAVRATRLVRQQEKRAEAPSPTATSPVAQKPSPASPAIPPTAKPTSGTTVATPRPAPPVGTAPQPPRTGTSPVTARPATPVVSKPVAPPQSVQASTPQDSKPDKASLPPTAPSETPTTAVDSSVSAKASELSPLNWELVQEEVATSFPNFAAYLEAGRFVSLEGGQITIGFAKQASLARSRMEKEDNLQALATLCERQIGQPVRIRVIELSASDPPGLTMAQVRAAKEQEQRMVLFEQARATPVAKQALDIFGADLAAVRTVAQKETGE
ncbi:DNA polymerase III subunit gamma/tau [Nitrospira lenta]|uniref:DNA polymerase III subunit gamma/tau n=1 Tax=Nitrospira lenta TaxID=1436998 RepID=A0A330L472_9BACT|nr:DNA polymerase III subunit gamma/tau [Nitrospira lenta]SPP64043.1 DNA polymerase III, gamma and tau subunits [Nitrospira lenta]